jgi:2-polyprenyl-6-methoxyphenol hydroxylase-like FAD-dependent oxidoreductase
MPLMRIAVLGGGPAGLYFASLWKRRHPGDVVRLWEQNPADATFGFGVVFSRTALEFLRHKDGQTLALIGPRLESWRDITIVHRGERVTIDGVGFSAIGRLDLLRLLQQQAREAGVQMAFGRSVTSLASLARYDLVVGADGVNSFVRKELAERFGTSISELQNHFIWYGTEQTFDTLTQTFLANHLGTFNAHHYRYQAGRSTFIVECDPATWRRAGLDRVDAEHSRQLCEQVFATTLQGRRLLDNKSIWRNFPCVRNTRWAVGNVVLIGDAAHTAHYSIGSGTRLALGDALALADSLAQARPDQIATALQRYEAERRPSVEKLVAASLRSAAWYARFAEHMRLEPLELAMSYLMRSGSVNDDRLRSTSPKFMARYARNSATSGQA